MITAELFGFRPIMSSFRLSGDCLFEDLFSGCQVAQLESVIIVATLTNTFCCFPVLSTLLAGSRVSANYMPLLEPVGVSHAAVEHRSTPHASNQLATACSGRSSRNWSLSTRNTGSENIHLQPNKQTAPRT